MKTSWIGVLAALVLSVPVLARSPYARSPYAQSPYAQSPYAQSPYAQSPYKVGQPLPELRLPTIDGEETIDLAQLRGKKLVLIEFASW